MCVCGRMCLCVRECVHAFGWVFYAKEILFCDDNHVASFSFLFLFFFVFCKKKKRIIVENTARGGSTCTVHLLTALFLS